MKKQVREKQELKKQIDVLDRKRKEVRTRLARIEFIEAARESIKDNKNESFPVWISFGESEKELYFSGSESTKLLDFIEREKIGA